MKGATYHVGIKASYSYTVTDLYRDMVFSPNMGSRTFKGRGNTEGISCTSNELAMYM